MQRIDVSDLREDLPFGARISGIKFENVKDEANRRIIRDTFEERGVLVFDNVEQSGRMQVALSEVIGPLKDHPLANVERVDTDAMPGVVVIRTSPKSPTVEADGETLVNWQPWHFDHSYSIELNRGGVMRSVVRPPANGGTGFADGVQIYNDLPTGIRNEIENRAVLYRLDKPLGHLRFAKDRIRVVLDAPDDVNDSTLVTPRSVHPAVWQRANGDKAVHISLWMALGFDGDETPAGDRLFEDVWNAILATMKPYVHEWNGTEMVAWDNHRTIHRGMGSSPGQERVMHRTTIKGDYGLGRWESEGDAAAGKALPQDVM